MKFPILLKTEIGAAPPGQLYYEVAENGVFQVRDTPLYRAVTRVHGPIPGLLPGAEELLIKFPRLPRAVTGDVLAFFDEVYRRWEGEAVVILFYCAARREYRVVAPPQTIPGRWRHDGRWRADYSVRYESVPRPEGFVRFGTIHSHADLPAYSSGLDCDDEHYEDGLHIVFGDLHRPSISVAAAFVAAGVRFGIAPDDVLDDWRVPARPARADWMAEVRREDRSAGGQSTGASTAGAMAGTAPAAASGCDGSNGADGAGKSIQPGLQPTTALAHPPASRPAWQERVDSIVGGPGEPGAREIGGVPKQPGEEGREES